MKHLTLIFFLSSLFLYPQDYPIKRLFNLSGDIEKPTFFFSPYYGGYSPISGNDLLFELQKDSVIDIYLSHYNPDLDSFSIPEALIKNGKLNINPSGKIHQEEKVIIFQTNYNNNWDLAYKEFKGGHWDETNILADSTGDEINPAFIIFSPFNYNEDTSLTILFEKYNSIYLYTKSNYNQTKTELIMQGSESIKFSKPTGRYETKSIDNAYVKGYEIVAKMLNKNIRKIVSVFKPINKQPDTNIVVIDSGEVDNPKFQEIEEYEISLTYEKDNNIYLENPYNFPITIEPLRSNVSGRIYNLNSISISRPVFKILDKKYDVGVHQPYTFVNFRNDSTFIFLGQDFMDYFFYDVFAYSRIQDNHPAAGFVGVLDRYISRD